MPLTPKSLIALIAAAALTGCGLTGSSPVSEEERRVGAQQHPQLLSEFGGAYTGDEAAYVNALGNKLAVAADLEGQCTFTLVNSDVVNAFAVPGCYIYVTRGLLAIVNSEAELASVLAHEIGHIAGKHSRQQEKRSFWRNLGVAAIGAITGSPELTRLAGSAATFFTLRHSRKHEYEADDLGLEYLSKAGYDPYAAADMLHALQRQQAFQQRVRGEDEARSMPEWTLTHPLTENRIERAREEAGKLGAQENALPEFEGRYLAAVDGLLYGDDPEQGFVIGRGFAHPIMRIAFEAPPGFTLTNSPEAILIEGPDGIRGAFAGGPLPRGGLPAYAEAVLTQTLGNAPFQVVASAAGQTNGGPALLVTALVQTQQGTVPVSVSVNAAPDGGAYHFILISPPGRDPSPSIAALTGSFRYLSQAEVAALRPRRIRVVAVQPGQTVETLARSFVGVQPAEQLQMLNGLDPAARLRPGQRVKIVEWAQ